MLLKVGVPIANKRWHKNDEVEEVRNPELAMM